MEIVWRPQAVQKVHGYTQCGTQDSTQKKAPQLTTSLQGKGYNHLEKKLPALASIVKGVGA